MQELPQVPTLKEVEQLAKKNYKLDGKAKRLAGEVDYNFYFKSTKGKEYTLKISRPQTNPQQLELELAILKHLHQKEFPFAIPKPISGFEGAAIIELTNKAYLRLQSWVPGQLLDTVNPRSTNLLNQWGRLAGQLSKHLLDFDHPAAHRYYKWDPAQCLSLKDHREFIHEPYQLELADYFWDLFEQKATPYLSDLRKSVNYNDGHEHNILVRFQGPESILSGLIDFGDALYTNTINELAICCAYAGMYMLDPLSAMSELVRGYHSVFPLEERELKVLFSLIVGRLMITVANAAKNKHQEPGNEYLLISEKPAWDLLTKLRSIAPELAHYTFREACDLEPCPQNILFTRKVASISGAFQLPVDCTIENLVPIDLSVSSKVLGNHSVFSEVKSFEKQINRYLEDQQATTAVGGYGEIRPFYTTDEYQVEGNNGYQWRTVHLGLDFWQPAGKVVRAVYPGKVVGLTNNEGACNYGPTMILEHHFDDGLSFFTLYGHLDLASLTGLKIGDQVEGGQRIGAIGDYPINGNWPPHLHFQIILDSLGNEGDFPGVAFPSQWPVWKSLCPDPVSIFSNFPKGKIMLSTNEILSKRKRMLGRSLSISYHHPIHVVRGFGQYLYVADGRRYLDTVNNVAHVGHEHPAVVRAGQQQMAVLNTNTRYLHQEVVLFAEELLATFPKELEVVYFVNSGSEANELALRMARTYSGEENFIAVEVGYHGNTGGTIAVSSYKFDGKGGEGLPAKTHIVPMPNTYRGIYRDTESAGKQYGDLVQEKINAILSSGEGVAGFICESILSCGGQVVLPSGYLSTVYPAIRKAGGLCIADEVQVGMGRVGERFWAFELQGVVPDIVTIGKPIGNGHPLAAVVTTKTVAEKFANGMEYFNTFGGNPVSSAIGRAVLATIQREQLQTNAKTVGKYLLEELKKLKAKYSIIGDVRGHGFFLGIELVKDHQTLSPASEEAYYIINRMRERGILMSVDGPMHNVLKIKPPLCFSRKNVQFLILNLEVVLRENFLWKKE